MLTIKILGTGCPNCKKLEKLTREAVIFMNIEADVVKVTDHTDIVEYGILTTPGLVINEKLVSSGRIPSASEISTLIADQMMEM